MNAPRTSPPRAPRRPRTWRFYAVLALGFAALGGGGFAVWKKFLRDANPRELYQIATVERGNLQDVVTATGSVQPRNYVDVGAQVSGQLKKLHVEVGSVVQSGDLLAEIDPTVLKATVDARRAGLRNQRATLKSNEAQLVLATLQYNRQKNLAAADATTGEALQVAEATMRTAQAQIEAVKAQIEQTESTLRADEATLNYARIYSPISGTVISVTARQGQTLNTNQSAPTLMRVADLSTMTVQTQVSEAEISKLRLGMEVYFTTLGSQGRRWYGRLRKVEPTPTVSNNVVLYNALFDVPNTNQALMPSMTTQVFFVAASAENALTVPAAALAMTKSQGRRRERGAADGGARGASAPGPATSSTAAAAPASAPASDPRGRFASMTPEERQAMRERRKARGGEPVNAAAAASAATSSPVAGDSTAGFSNTPRAPAKATVKVIDAKGNIEERQVELGVTTRVQAQVLSGLNEGEEVIVGLKLPPAAARGNTSGSNNPMGGMQPPGSGRSR